MDAAELWARARDRLRARRYAEGWPLFEARREAGVDVWTPITPAPRWAGEPIAGRRIVVCAEQGYGDQLMFGRYLSLLREGGAEVVVACDPRALARLFETLGYWTRPCWTDRPIPEADYWVNFGSLPFGLGLAEPPPARYLDLPLGRGGGVGVVCSGSARHANDANRSLDPESAAALRRLGRDLAPEATGAFDLLDTAAMVADLDLVITVDTAVAHLAGAMGKPCWVLLPFQGLDWRWNDGLRSDWYPEFRLFTQRAPGDWPAVIGQVKAALTTLT